MSWHVDAIYLVGGSAIIGSVVEVGIKLARPIRRGLPVATVQFVLDSGRLSLSKIDRIVLPRKTLAHQRKLATLTPEQSDRLVRVARVIDDFEDTFGNRAKAAAYLRCPNTALASEQPLDLSDTDEGAREVETLLGRIAHGIAV